MSFDTLESSSDISVNGFFGNSQAATIVDRDDIKGPENAIRVIGPFPSSLRDEQDTSPTASSKDNHRLSRVISGALAWGNPRVASSPAGPDATKAHSVARQWRFTDRIAIK